MTPATDARRHAWAERRRRQQAKLAQQREATRAALALIPRREKDAPPGKKDETKEQKDLTE
jgi:hypothetical protein